MDREIETEGRGIKQTIKLKKSRGLSTISWPVEGYKYKGEQQRKREKTKRVFGFLSWEEIRDGTYLGWGWT